MFDAVVTRSSRHSYSVGGGAYIATRSRMYYAPMAHGAAPMELVSEFNQLFVSTRSKQRLVRQSTDSVGHATNPNDNFQLYWDANRR